MFDFHEKRKIRNILYSRITIGVIFLAAALMVVPVYNRYEAASEMKSKLTEKREELNEMKHRAEVMHAKVEYLKNERGIEEELRNRFDVAREGEQVIILLDNDKDQKKRELPLATSTQSTVQQVEKIEQEKKNFFEKMKFWKSEG